MLLILLVLLAVILGLRSLGRLRSSQVVVWEWEQGLLFRHGQFQREVPPGTYITGRSGRMVVAVRRGPRMLLLPAQESLTADGFPVRVGAVLFWEVADARQFHAATADSAPATPEQLHVAVQLALRSAVGARTLDALLATRGATAELDAELLPDVSAVAAGIGARATRLTVRDLVLPAEVRRMVTEVERARREGLAALERARNEHASLRSLANAARLMRGNPELQTLRTLQSLNPEIGRAAPTLVLNLSEKVLPQASREQPTERSAPEANGNVID